MAKTRARRSSSSSSSSTPKTPPISSCSTSLPSDAANEAESPSSSALNAADLSGILGQTLLKVTVESVDSSDPTGRSLMWLSEAAMLEASLASSQLVAVSVKADCAEEGPLLAESLERRVRRQHGLGFEEGSESGLGTYFAFAVAWPSHKLNKYGVRLSKQLARTLGEPVLGLSISISVIKADCKNQELEKKWNLTRHKEDTPSLLVCESKCLSLEWCPPGETFGRFDIESSVAGPNCASNEDMSSILSSHQLQTSASAVLYKQSPGKTPVFSSIPREHKFISPGSRGEALSRTQSQVKLKMPDFGEEGKLKDLKPVWSIFSCEAEKGKMILEKFAARWLQGSLLLHGSLILLPICGRECVFQVKKAEMHPGLGGCKVSTSSCDTVASTLLSEAVTTKLASLTLSSPPYTAYYVSSNTTITLMPPQKREATEECPPVVSLNSAVSSSKVSEQEKLKTEPAKNTNYASLGGLSEQTSALKEIMEYSLLRPELLTRFGLQPARGVLLYGPPGSGKTSLAYAAAFEAGVSMFSVNGPEIVSEFYGESEKALREVFSSAQCAAPSVVFIDELDAITPERKEGSEELGQRLVAELLSLMDGGGKQTLDRVLVIAATNRPEVIDPALRRPGRFDREIEVGVPTPSGRREILEALLLTMDHSLSAIDIESLAAATHGFVGADMSALCNEAAMTALRRHVEAISSSKVLSNGLTYKVLAKTDKDLKLCINWKDFQVAKTRVKPSAMREVMLEIPKVKWHDIGGQDEIKQKLKEAVEWPQKHGDAFSRIGAQPPRGVLLYGPPGCSKTLMAQAVATETGLNFIAVKGPELFSKWVGESEKAVRSLFVRARAAAPSVVFFDEIDGLAVARDSGSGEGLSVGDRVLSQLLVELDGLIPRSGVSVIAATNRPDKIDAALLRPGRLDRLLYVGPPDEASRRQIFEIHLRRTPCRPDIQTKELAARTAGYTGADIAAVCREAAMAALEEDFSIQEVCMHHFESALARVQPSDPGFNYNFAVKFERGLQTSV